MKKKLHLLLLFCLVLGLSILTSCKKENIDETSDPQENPIDTILCNFSIDFDIQMDTIAGGTILEVIGVGGLEPYIYEWSDGTGENNIEITSSGTYSITMTDTEGCTAVNDTTLMLSDPCDGFMVDIVEFGIDSISLETNVVGGNLPYSYLWSTGAMTSEILVVNTGSYSVTVTDADNCEAEEEYSVMVSDPCAIFEVGIMQDSTMTTLTAIPVAGTAPYSYLWSQGGATQSIPAPSPGTYEVTATDANGCEAEDTIEL